jgi:uncharacterized HhH-GPD family protein
MLNSDVTDGGLARMIQTFNETGVATGSEEADDFLRGSSTAVLMGILFDQRIRAEVAFSGPYKLRTRLGHFDMRQIAEMDPEAFSNVFSQPPAIHRFSNVMASRTQEFAQKLVEEYDGAATAIWSELSDLQEVKNRILAFPGFGPGKLKKLQPAMALFGHQLPV